MDQNQNICPYWLKPLKNILINHFKPYEKKLDPTRPSFITDHWLTWSSPQDFIAQLSEWRLLEHVHSLVLLLLPLLPPSIRLTTLFFFLLLLILVIIITIIKHTRLITINYARDKELKLILKIYPNCLYQIFPSPNHEQECNA